MSRQTDRYKQRLSKLADFIEANPKTFDQWNYENCIIGIGNRLSFAGGKVKLKPHYVWDGVDTFSERYGISIEDSNSIFDGNYRDVSKRFKNYGESTPTAKTAVKLVRSLYGG